ncbi:armadillo-like helical domain-containing protein 2 [Gracilinanus agilis]|uniref:armadillo-like helical domain-containing protein 2 n=1 Tax=Gracilinanus agilis TaxID=191870 RepID=UPI001CFD9DFE|nr:armadillo-like helical domain-containing protein 2 [Gracilinanus agilis]
MTKKKRFYQKCFAAVCKLFRKIHKLLERCGLAEEQEKKMFIGETIFHKEKIIPLGFELRNQTLPLEKRALAAHKMGQLAFTGGQMAAKWVTDYMSDVAILLCDENASPQVMVMLIESMCSWCYLNPVGQKKARLINMIPILMHLLEEENIRNIPKEPMIIIKFWACYLLCIISCNNALCIQQLREYTNIKPVLKLLAKLNWQGWPDNYAQVLFYLMGFQMN